MLRFPNRRPTHFFGKIKKIRESLVKKQVLKFTSTRSCVINTNCLKLSSILRFCSLLDMDSPVIYIFYHLIISCRLNVRFKMQSCVHSFYYFFFLPDRPTHLRESEGDGKRNILLGWPKGHVNFASHNCLFTSSVLQGKGKNGEKQRQSASDASRIDPSYLSARVQFSRLYPHPEAWSQAKRHPTTVSSYTHFSREHFLGYPEY